MKAMLLAAGRGERMGALTQQTPKPLLQLKGKPLLLYHIERLRAAGFKELVINTSYLGEQIRAYVGTGAQWGVDIQCTTEAQRLETAGGIINALPLLGDEPFLVVNSDVWTDFPLSTLKEVAPGKAHLVLVDNPPHHPEGDFALAQTTHQVGVEGEPKLTFSGVSVLSPMLFNGVASGKSALAPLLRAAMAEGEVTGEYYRGLWVDVGTPERLEQVATLINSTNDNSQQRSEGCR